MGSYSLKNILYLFDLKGKVVMGIWSLAMIGLSIYSTVAQKSIDSSVAAMYGMAVAAYAGTKGVETYTQSKVTLVKEEGDV